MDREERDEILRAGAGFGDQDANGVALSLLRANLMLSPTESIEKMRRALALLMEVRRAGEAAGLSRR